MSFDSFRAAERDGWNDRAAGYTNHTWLATGQIAPTLIRAVHLRPTHRLLDMACGTGNVTAAADALGCEAVGVDFAPDMVRQAQNAFPNVTFEMADAQDLPYAPASFDAVICNMGLFHMTDPACAMAEPARVLKPRGRFAWSQWCAPADSLLYATLFGILAGSADMSLAEPAPDAFALSDADNVKNLMEDAGFESFACDRLETTLIAHGDDFFEFFLDFGVRVPLIVAAQSPQTRRIIRAQVNSAMAPWKTTNGFEVPMPSFVYSGVKP